MAKTAREKHKQQRKSLDKERTVDSSDEFCLKEKSGSKSKKKRKLENVSSSPDTKDNNEVLSHTKISKRIILPSDCGDVRPHSQKSPSKSVNLLQTFKDVNELSETVMKPDKLLSMLAESDVFFIQIPKNLHPQLLKDTLVSLNENAKLRVADNTYIWDTSDANQVSLNVMGSRSKKGKCHIKRLTCRRIIVREQFNRRLFKQSPIELEESCEAVLFPDNLKTRHPLFGSDYVDRIKLDESTERKLISAEHGAIVHEKKRKRRKHLSDLKNESDIYEELFSAKKDFGSVMGETNDGLNPETKRKKKKKSKK